MTVMPLAIISMVRHCGNFAARDKSIGVAWRAHVKFFPQSRKRLLFGGLVVLAALSVPLYPLWLAFH